jgi:hypothetical protein
VLHEHAASLSAASHANRSRRLTKCAKDSGHYHELRQSLEEQTATSDGLLTPEEEQELPPELPEATGPEPHCSSVGVACARSIDTRAGAAAKIALQSFRWRLPGDFAFVQSSLIGNAAPNFCTATLVGATRYWIDWGQRNRQSACQ